MEGQVRPQKDCKIQITETRDARWKQDVRRLYTRVSPLPGRGSSPTELGALTRDLDCRNLPYEGLNQYLLPRSSRRRSLADGST